MREVHRNWRRRDWELLKESAIYLYSKGKSIKEISKEIDVCDKKVSKILQEEGIPIKKGTEYNRNKTYNTRYFSDIDSIDKAYFLGLLYADGNIYLKRNRIQISLLLSDWYIVEKFCSFIEYEGNTYMDREKYPKLIIDSKKMCQDLISKGCLPNKSFTLMFPSADQVPSHLISHFIRGFFDGDGGVCKRGKTGMYISFTSNESFLSQISKFLKENLNIEFGRFYPRYKNKSFSCGSISLYRGAEILRLFEFLYENSSGLFLKRKHEKLQVYLTQSVLWTI